MAHAISSERRSVVQRGARKGSADEHHHAAGCREQSYKFRRCSCSTLRDGNRRYGGHHVPSTVLPKVEGRQELGWPREAQKILSAETDTAPVDLSLHSQNEIVRCRPPHSSERRSVVQRGARKGSADEHHHAAGCREQSYKFRRRSCCTPCRPHYGSSQKDS